MERGNEKNNLAPQDINLFIYWQDMLNWTEEASWMRD